MLRRPLRLLMALASLSALAALIIIAANLKAQPPRAPASASAAPPPNPGDSLVITGAAIFDQIVYLPVRVNEAGPYPFVLDTGAGPTSVLDSGLADSLGLSAEPFAETGGAGEETVPVGALAGVQLTLGELDVPAAPAYALPLRRLDPHWGKRKDGLVAGDILARFLTVIDYEREQVVLYPPAAAASLPGVPIPLEVVDQFLFVQAELLLHGQEAPLPALMMVDTGLRVTTFNRPFAERHGLAAQSPRTATGVTGFGIGGVSRGVLGRLRGLRIGELTIESPVVAFSLDAKGALASENFAGILGADILSRCRVGLDYAGARLILAPGASFAAPNECDMSGIRFVMPGERFERLEVFFVFPDSPAAEAGIVPGDRVTAIDGRPAASFTREALRVYMQRDGERVTLVIEREGKPITVTLRLRRLV